MVGWERRCCAFAEGRMTGDIRVCGHPKQQRSFTRVAAYVEQTDVVRLRSLPHHSRLCGR